ncbi:MAG: peptidoglycan bridge formation glycyltransferase FemA/FemB family protein [Candidatus Staskawiczbacteria bacterium]|nr:peptidoglycan bridge formation glycyltransferase FemA/FemB family protein [Candidatus Staskawiczbacteria bacterium]
MEVREITNKGEWENFLSDIEEKTFLHSWNWGEFNKNMGFKLWRFGVFEQEKLAATALVLKITAKRGVFLFIPHGPLIADQPDEKSKREILESILSKLKILAKEEKAAFIRISPLFPGNGENEKIFKDLGFRSSPMHSSAYEATWKLNINYPEDELIKSMRKTTRYLIKKAEQNKSIEIIKSRDYGDIETYQKLNKAVSERRGFVPFSDDFIKKEFEAFFDDKEALFIFGKYDNKIAAGAMVIFWKEIGFYHQAASLAEFAKFSIPYLLQWEAIKEARSRGCLIYDFWGFIDPEKFPRHPWAGPTLFKMGFGGYKREYVKAQDFIISKKYWLNYIIEKTRKIKRRL